MIPILIFEAIFFVVEFVYFLFADIKDIAMIGFYSYEIICLVLFTVMAIILLLLFLHKDYLLILEIISMNLLILTDVILIILSASIWHKTPVYEYIDIWIGRAIWMIVIVLRFEQFKYKATWVHYLWKISKLKTNWNPV